MFYYQEGTSTTDPSGTGITVNPNGVSPVDANLPPYYALAYIMCLNGTGGGASSTTGTVIWWSASTAPVGYVTCNGAAVSRTTYSNLFGVIGTTYGNGDGSTTFNLPDLRAEFIRGWDDGRGVDPGRVFGSAQADEFKSHAHTIATRGSVLSGGFEEPATDSTGLEYAYPTSLAGGTETRPRNIALLPCIKY
jgi:microcystin-dependent protein